MRYQTASVLIIGVNAAGDVQLLDGCAIDVAEWGTIIIIKGFLFSATIEGEGLLFGTRKGACKRVVACAHHNRVACVLFHRNGDVFSEADILATIGVALFDGIGKYYPVCGSCNDERIFSGAATLKTNHGEWMRLGAKTVAAFHGIDD